MRELSGFQKVPCRWPKEPLNNLITEHSHYSLAIVVKSYRIQIGERAGALHKAKHWMQYFFCWTKSLVTHTNKVYYLYMYVIENALSRSCVTIHLKKRFFFRYDYHYIIFAFKTHERWIYVKEIKPLPILHLTIDVLKYK